MLKADICAYISGKYSSDCLRGTENNIKKAEEVAILLAQKQIKYFCPHTHSRLMDFYAPEASWDYWMELDLHFIGCTCNCMIMLDNWQDSKGATLEYNHAKELGLPIFFSFDDFMSWYNLLQ